MELEPGAYDALVTRSIVDALAVSDLVPSLSSVDSAEAADEYAALVSDAVRSAVALLPSGDRVERGAALVNDLLAQVEELASSFEAGPNQLDVPEPRSLVSLVKPVPSGKPEPVAQPKTALSETALLTNATGEPTLLGQLESELASADGVDILGAFIRFSGIREVLPHIRRLTARGGVVRVLTTTYTGTTQKRALDELEAAGAQVRVSYDRTATRLHAKAWMFRRNSGFTTVYIGSSNLTHQAQVTGLEWNVRASVVTNAAVIDKFDATFESYWNDQNFTCYDADEFEREHQAAVAPSDSGDFDLSFMDLLPKPFQQGLLEQVEFERMLGHNKNLIVAATGTGKTVMAAIDYRNQRATLERANLLFVAHRKEILKQSLATFRVALKDRSFGLDRQARELNKLTTHDLTDANLKRVFQQMIDDGIAPASRARLLSVLRGMSKWLIRNGHLQVDPTIDFETPQTARHLPVALTDRQLSAVLHAAAKPHQQLRAHWVTRDIALVGLLAGCGLRSAELTELRYSAIHRVEPYRVTVEGKGSKQRTVPLSAEVLEAIDRYLAERTDINPARINPNTIVFVRNNGEPLNNQALQLLVTNWLAAAGVPPTPGEKAHLFRHTYAVSQIDRGTSIAELCALLGHENISTTSQYLRLTADGLHHTARATAVNDLLTHHFSLDL